MSLFNKYNGFENQDNTFWSQFLPLIAIHLENYKLFSASHKCKYTFMLSTFMFTFAKFTQVRYDKVTSAHVDANIFAHNYQKIIETLASPSKKPMESN